MPYLAQPAACPCRLRFHLLHPHPTPLARLSPKVLSRGLTSWGVLSLRALPCHTSGLRGDPNMPPPPPRSPSRADGCCLRCRQAGTSRGALSAGARVGVRTLPTRTLTIRSGEGEKGSPGKLEPSGWSGGLEKTLFGEVGLAEPMTFSFATP